MNYHKKSICLIGLPSVGKSTIAKELVKTGEFKIIDTDELIKAKIGDVNLNFLLLNSEKFFQLQSLVVQEIDYQPNLLISTGGAIIYDQSTMEYLRGRCFIIYLKCDLNVCLQRLEKNPKPIFSPGNQSLHATLQGREALYEKWAHKTINCDNKDCEQICLEIREQTHNSLNPLEV